MKFNCKECRMMYPASEFSKCRRHTSDQVYNSEGLLGRGMYPCCNKVVLKFTPFKTTQVSIVYNYQGCHYFPHVPTINTGKNYNLFSKNARFISWISSCEDLGPTRINASEILLPEAGHRKWNFKDGSYPPYTELPKAKKRTKISLTETQFEQRRNGTLIFQITIDSLKMAEWKDFILQSRNLEL